MPCRDNQLEELDAAVGQQLEPGAGHPALKKCPKDGWRGGLLTGFHGENVRALDVWKDVDYALIV